MSRSSWKFLPFLESDAFAYLNFITKRFKQHRYWSPKRYTTINSLNCYLKAQIHQGKIVHHIRPLNPTLVFKFGSLSKTRKPFFFRSKKK